MPPTDPNFWHYTQEIRQDIAVGRRYVRPVQALGLERSVRADHEVFEVREASYLAVRGVPEEQRSGNMMSQGETSGQFRGQIALITGAGSGIGRAIALELSAQGAGVRLVGRHGDSLQATASACARSAPVWCDALDITADHGEIARRIDSECGGMLDMLIHSAGVISMGETETASAEEFDMQYQTNLRAPFLLTQALLHALRQRRGQVVFLNSSAGTSARRGIAQYAATKHGLKAVADSLREEVNGQGIRVSSVFVGRTATPMQERVYEFERLRYDPEKLIQPEDIGRMVATILALPRTVEVVDVSLRPFEAPARVSAMEAT